MVYKMYYKCEGKQFYLFTCSKNKQVSETYSVSIMERQQEITSILIHSLLKVV